MNILVVGSSSGIGKEIAQTLFDEGHTVFGAARTSSNAPYTELEMDVRYPNTIEQVLEQVGKIDALVYSAGIGLASPVEETAREDYIELFDVNLFGLCECVRLCLPYLNAGGRIVAISSMAGAVNVPFNAYYCASKAAVNSFISGLNMEIKGKGLCATAIMPGGTRTAFTFKRKKYCSEKYMSALKCSLNVLSEEEQQGAQPSAVAQKVLYALTCANPPVLLPVTLGCKATYALERLLPKKLAEQIIEHKYLS